LLVIFWLLLTVQDLIIVFWDFQNDHDIDLFSGLLPPSCSQCKGQPKHAWMIFINFSMFEGLASKGISATFDHDMRLVDDQLAFGSNRY